MAEHRVDSTSRRPRSHGVSAARGLRIAGVAVLAVFGTVALVLSFVPYGTLRAHVDAFAVDRSVGLTRGEFDSFDLRLRILAVACGAACGALVAGGGRLDRATARLASALWLPVVGTPTALRRWLAGEERSYLAALGVVLVAGVVVRLLFLDVPMRYDEATTYDNYVSKPLYIGLANYSTPNNHLLHTFLAKLSVTAFGSAPWAVRLPALLAGLAILPATFALARVHYGRLAALLATALAATSSTLVEYSTNARGYTLVVLLTLVALLAGARVIERGSPSAWAVIAIAGSLGLFAVPIMIYALGGVFLWLVLTFVLERRSAAAWVRPLVATGLAIAVLTALLYAPVFAASGIRSVTSNEFVQSRSFGAMLAELPDHGREVFATWHRDLPLAVTTALAVGALASLVFTRRLSRFAVPPLLPLALVGILAIAAQRVVPYPRVWLFLLPLFFVTAAGVYGRLLERVPRSTVVGAAAAAVVAAAGVAAVVSADSVRTSRETGGLLDAAPVAALLAREVEPGDRVFAPGSDVILEYYLGREGIDGGALLYEQDCRPRTFVVVNLLGGQTLSSVLPQLTTAGDLGRPVLVRRYPSAAVYSVERACGAVTRSA